MSDAEADQGVSIASSAVQDVILALYRGCRDISLTEFKGWAMEAVRRLVEFDSGIWVTSDIVSDTFSSVFLFHQPRAMMENYYRTVNLSGDVLAQTAIANAGHTIRASDVIPRREFLAHPTYIDHCRLYGMEHALCTCYISPFTRVPTGMSFYRADPTDDFTEADRRAKELLVPHMIEAMRINLFSWLSIQYPPDGNALAVCDAVGRLYETTPRFPELLRAVWPDWTGPLLQLPIASLDGQGVTSWSSEGLKFQTRQCMDLYLVNVAEMALVDRLSPRQFEIGEMLAKGKRYKDIARELNISPSTVTNHVNQIHARLEIETREELIRLFTSRDKRQMP